MTGKQAIKILRRFNKRQRDSTGKMRYPYSVEITEAINVAVAIIEHYTMTGEIDRVHVNTDKLK